MILKNKRSSKVSSNNGDIDREEAAWEYLKWWMSTDTQVDFGITLQTTYGEEYIWNSANIEAFSKLPWKSRDKQTILEEMQNIQETPRIPGTYMLEREISNAYVAVVTNGGILRTELDSAIKRIDRETTRKLKEFGYLDNDGNVIKEYIVPDVNYVQDIIDGLD
jgi:ABC-type glycerol-3-phosphate transport system substrate-binding protein